MTNAKPEIAEYDYTTKEPVIGTLIHDGIHFQIIDMPAADYENFDQGTTNTADILLLLIKNIQEIEQIYPFIEKSIGRRIILITKMDLLSLIIALYSPNNQSFNLAFLNQFNQIAQLFLFFSFCFL